jgi:hypothetical protein
VLGALDVSHSFNYVLGKGFEQAATMGAGRLPQPGALTRGTTFLPAERTSFFFTLTCACYFIVLKLKAL